MPTQRVDMVVVGGGIHGAGVAQAAAAAGHSVLLLEQTGLASGTSSRSSKLIHGGLRYLESAQYGLVRECLRERERLLRIAPELVHLQRFYIPVYRDTTRRPWLLRTGLTVYSVLGGMRAATRFRTIPRRAWSQLDGLTTDGLQAVFQYHDAQTDDSALTRAVMHSAIQLGAELKVPASFRSARLTEHGCEIEYEHDGRATSCQATVLVNAAGAWVNQVLTGISPRPVPVAIDLVQGTHILLRGELTGGIYYLEAPQDGRAVFAMPWDGCVLVGTTETLYAGDPAAVAPLPEEISYLLDTVRRYFPAYRHVRPDAMLGAFAGLRVLPAAADSAFHRRRETVLHADRPAAPRVITVYGGKLTAYRITAQRVIQRCAGALPPRKPVADTARLLLRPS